MKKLIALIVLLLSAFVLAQQPEKNFDNVVVYEIIDSVEVDSCNAISNLGSPNLVELGCFQNNTVPMRQNYTSIVSKRGNLLLYSKFHFRHYRDGPLYIIG